MAEWTWYSCDLRTGRLLTTLPIQTQGTVQTVLSGQAASGLLLPVLDDRCPADWPEATIRGRTVLAAEVNDRIVWAGRLVRRRLTGEPTVELACKTIESYLGVRYIDTEAVGPFNDTDQSSIVRELIEHANVSGIGIVVDAPASGILRDAEYHRYSDQKIFDELETLSDSVNGPEWVIETRWADDPNERRLEYVMRVGTPLLGAVTNDPEWVFRYGQAGNIVDFAIDQSADDGEYANVVVAGGEGDGKDRIMSTSGIAQDADALAMGWPLAEVRSATQLKTQASVDDDARGQLEQLKDGTDTLSLTAKVDDLQLTSAMWGLGDTCKVVIELGTPSLPRGFEGLARIVGWSIDPAADTITPTTVPYERVN